MKASILQYFGKIKSFHREAKLFMLITFAVHFLNGGYQVVFNLYLSSLGYGSGFIGTVDSVRLIVGATLAIPMGILCTRIGYRKTLRVTGLMIFLSILGLANITYQPLIFGLCIIWGLAFVMNGIIIPPFLAHYSTPEERTHLFGVNFSLQMWAAMLGNFLGGSLAESLQYLFPGAQAYQYTLNLFSIVAVLALVPTFFMKPGQTTTSKRSNFAEVVENLVKVTKYRDVRRYLLYTGMIGIGAGLVVPLFNIFLRLRLQATDFQIGTLICLTQIATSIGCLLTPYLIKLIGQSLTVVASQLLSIPFLIIVGAVPYFPIVGVAYFLRSSLMNMVNPIIDSISMQLVSEDERATSSSLNKTINNFGRGIGVYMSGLLLAGGNYIIPYILTCCLYIGGSLVFYYSFRANHNLVNKDPGFAAAK